MVKLLSLGGLVLVVVGLLGCDAGGFDSIEHISNFGGLSGKNTNSKTPAQVAEWNRRDAELKLQRERERLINELMAKLFEQFDIPKVFHEMLRKAAASHQRNLGTVEDATVGFADIPQRLLGDKVQIPEVEA